MQNDMVSRNFICYEVLIFSVVIEIAANTTIMIGLYDIDSTSWASCEENWFTIG